MKLLSLPWKRHIPVNSTKKLFYDKRKLFALKKLWAVSLTYLISKLVQMHVLPDQQGKEKGGGEHLIQKFGLMRNNIFLASGANKWFVKFYVHLCHTPFLKNVV